MTVITRTGSPSVKRRRPRRTGESAAAAVLLVPDLLGLTLIYIGPILFTIYLSFQAWNGITPEREFVGFDNYTALFSDPTWIKSLGVSAGYVLLYVPLVTGGALLLALLLAQRLPESAFFRTIFFLPMAVPLVVAALVWQLIFNPTYGFMNFLLESVGLPAQPWL